VRCGGNSVWGHSEKKKKKKKEKKEKERRTPKRQQKMKQENKKETKDGVTNSPFVDKPMESTSNTPQADAHSPHGSTTGVPSKVLAYPEIVHVVLLLLQVYIDQKEKKE
jgi:hypothetical protein